MPSKPQVTLKSIPPVSNGLTLTLEMSNDSSDDDFQSPSQAISLTQSLIFSSFQNPTLQPLKPSSSARPKKKAKAGSSGRKENSKIRKNPKEPELDVSGSRRKPAENPISQPLKPYNAAGTPKEPKQVASVGKENSKIMEAGGGSVIDFEVSTECSKGNGIGSRSMYLLKSIEWRLLQSRAVCGSAVGNGCSLKKPKLGETGSINDCESMVNPDADFGIHGCNGEKVLNVESGYFLNSIESKFVEQAIENVGAREDNFGDFEPSTQLNELMNLCSEMGEGENLSRGVLVDGDIGANAENLSSSVECPLCGADISDLSEELRQLHTNDCLDRDETSKVIIPSDKMVIESPQQQVVDVSPVLEWLRILGLSRYEEAFIKEEIDWDTLQWLSEEDLLSIGITALGPRKKIVHALNELRRNMHGHDSTTDSYRTTTDENKKVVVPGNKLITEFFQGPSAVDKNRMSAPLGACHRVDSSSESGHNRAAVRHRANNGKVRDIPPWCCIPGTPFRVDAFRYLRRDCSHWFLTHFHLDHYQGLTRGFCHGKIYCSSITARLVNMKIGIPWDRLQVLPLNQKISIAGINVTFLDANHCPGSVVILFEPPNNKAVLHTGDFRFSDEMASMPLFQSCSIHTLILDTTYCNPQYDFPKQEAVIQFVVDAIQAEAFNPKTLFLIGSYTIGKERLFLEVARCLHKKIYVGAAKLQLLQCLELPEEDMQWVTLNEHESHIHVVPMWTIASFKRMKYISNQYSARFNLIVAFSPTGWTFGKGKKKSPGRRCQQGTIIRYEVPYSEHCSFTELREFVQFVSPENIIPSVNNNGPETADAMISLLMSDS